MKTTIRELTNEQTKKDLKVLEPNETRRQKIWEECVKEAKMLVKINDETRIKIVNLARKACVIHYGGGNRYNPNRYTIKAFAEAIGITYKTLVEWHAEVKVNDQINEQLGTATPFNSKHIRQVSRQMRNTVSTRSPQYAQELIKAHNKVKAMSQNSLKMASYTRDMKSILFNVKNKPMLKDVDREILVEMLHLSREISKNLQWVDYEVKEKAAPKTQLRKATA